MTKSDHSKVVQTKAGNFELIVIEDDPDLGRLVQKELNPHGFKTSWAQTGKEAMKLISGKENEILIVDYKLPDMTAKELIRKLNKQYTYTPNFVTLIEYGNAKEAAEMMRLGGRDYIVKEPDFLEALPEVIKQICKDVETAQQLAKAEQQLHENLELLKETGDMARVGGWDIDMETHKVYWTDTTKKIHEVPEDYLPTLEEAVSFFPDESGERIQKAVDQAIQKGIPYNLELQFVTARGKKLWVQALGKPELKNGKCIRLNGTFQDITRRKEAENELKIRNAVLKRTEAIAQVGSWEWDVANDTVTWSDELFQIFRLDPGKGAVTYADHPEIYTPESMDKLDRAVKECLKNGTPYTLDLEIIRGDGTHAFCTSRGLAKKDENGKVIRLFGSFQDITVRKNAEDKLKAAYQQLEANEQQLKAANQQLKASNQQLVANERELRSSEERLKLIIDQSPFPVSFADPKGEKIYYWGQSAINLFGHVVNTVSEWYELAYPDPEYRKSAIKRWGPAVEKAKEGRKIINAGEYDIACKDGSVKTCEIYAQFIPDYLVVTFNDVTERKEAEDALRISQENLQNTFDLSPSIISKVNLNTGYFIEANRAVTKILGYSVEEFTSTPFMELIHPDDRISSTEEKEAQIKGKEVTFFENRYLCTDGSYKWLAWYGTGADKNGIVTAIGTDITERKKAEQAVKESEEKYRAMYQNAPLAYQSLNINGEIKDVNPQWLKTLDFTREKVIGKWFGDFLAPDYREHFRKNFQLFKKKGAISGIEFNMLRSDSTIITVSFEGCIGYDDEGNFKQTYCTFKDITKQKRAEDKLVFLNKTIGELIAIDDKKKVFEYFTNSIHAVYPKTIVLYVSVDETKHNTTLESISGLDSSILSKINKLANRKFIGKQFKLTQQHQELFRRGSFYDFKGGLAEFSAGEVPASTSNVIQKLLNINKIYTIGVNRNNKILGAVHIFSLKGSEIADGSFLETYTNHFSSVVENLNSTNKLQESEEKYRSLTNDVLDNQNVGVFILDANFQIVWINKTIEQYFGINKNVVIGKDKRQTINNSIQYIFEDPETFKNKVFATYDNNVYVENFICTVKQSNKTQYRILEHYSRPITDGIYSGGRIEYYYDITERKRAEDQIKEKNEQFETIIKGANLGWWDWDIPSGDEIYNDILTENLGYTLSEVKPHINWWEDKIHPDDAEQVAADLKEHFDGKTEFYENKHRLKTKSGAWRWFYDFGKVVERDSKGNATRMIGSLRDIDYEERAKERITDSLHQIKVINANTPNIIWKSDIDAKGNFMNTYISEVADQFLGLPDGSINNSWDQYFSHILPKYLPAIDDMFKKGIRHPNKSFSLDYEVKKADGKIAWFSSTGRAIADKNKITVYGATIDITEKKQNELELIRAREEAEKGQANIAAIIEGTNNSIWAFNRNYEILYINHTFQQEFLQSFGVLLNNGSNLLKSIPESLQPFWKERYDRVLSNEQFEIEDAIPTDKGTIYIQVSFNPIVKNGKVIGGSCFGSDISLQRNKELELKKAKEHAEENAANLKLAQQIANIGNWHFDPEIGRPVWSDYIFEIYERDPKDGEPHIDEYKKMYEPEQYEVFNQAFLAAIKEGRKYDIVLKLNLPHNRIKWINTICQPDKSRKSDAGYFLRGTIQDITQQKNAELELKKAKAKAEESEAKLLEAQEISHVGSWEYIIDTDTVTWSKELYHIFERSYDLPAPKFSKQRPFYTAETFAMLEKAVQDCVQYEKPYDIQLDIYTPDGSVKHIISKGNVKKDGNNKVIGIYGTAQDITLQKKLENQLVKAKEKAEEADRLKSAFLANMSHEIRTPMNGILGFTDLLKEPDLSGEERKQFIEIIRKSGDRMLNTVNDIIDISKIDAGQMEVSKTVINIKEEIETHYEFFREEARTKGLEMRLIKNLPEQASLVSDKNKLNSVISNLIKNAIKYTDNGSIEIHCSKRDTDLEVSVSDTGIGIAADRVNAIFNRFEQADIDDRHAREGSGLGLAISEAYVHMLGGQMGVESEAGKGSRFYFTLPWAANETKPEPMQEKALNTAEGNSQAKVLIAEDDDISFEHLEIILKKMVQHIARVENGKDAVDYMKNNADVDIILMDIKLPLMSGYEATKEIRKFNKHVTIIAQTAYALEGDKEKAIAAGCNNYIAKPIQQKKLLEMINKYF